MTFQERKIDAILKHADPVISNILDKAISEKEITTKDALELFEAKGVDFHLVGMVAVSYTHLTLPTNREV